MRRHQLVKTAALLSLLALGPSISAQDEAVLPDSVTELLDAALDQGGPEPVIRLSEHLDALDLDHDRDPLTLVTAWQGFLRLRRAERLERAWGTGRVIEDSCEYEEKGETFVFEYAYRLPKNYRHDEAWPVVLCLPDRGEGGEDYLDDIWSDDREMRDIADQFVLIAPNAIEKTSRTRIGRRKYSKVVRVERFDRHHSLSMVLPLMKVLETINGDVDRIFVEGRGAGAVNALDLAALYGVEMFAGVAVPPTKLSDPRIADGLDGVPQLQLNTVEDEGWSSERLREVADFYANKVRQDFPEEVHLATNNPIFRQRAWIKVTGHAIGEDRVADIHARIEPESNSVMVSASGVYAFTIFLNDAMLDLDRPVRVVVDGAVVSEEIVERSTEYLVGQMRSLRPGETSRIYSACLPLDMPIQLQDSGKKAAEGDE